MARTVCLILLIFFLSAPFFAFSQNEGFNPNEEQQGTRIEIDIDQIFLGLRNHAYEDISDQIFNKVSTFDVGVAVNGYTTIIGQVRRKVYDHSDGTYSVADFFGLKGVIAPGENIELLGLPFYTAIGGELGTDCVHIRNLDHKPNLEDEAQVLPPNDPWYVEVWHSARAQWFGARLIVNLINGTWNGVIHAFRSPNDEFYSRYENPLDLVLPPFRLPLTVREFIAMSAGEIYSYSVMGGFFWVNGIGWKEGPFTANYGLNLFWRKAFRVTVLKEKNGNFARVKVSNLGDLDRGLGVKGYSLGGKTRWDLDIIKGAFFGSDLKGSIIPIRQSSSDTDIAFEDQVFRYDMRTSEGVAAYEKAVLGNFIDSGKLVTESGPIQSDYVKNTETDSHADESQYNILIWRHQKKFQLDNSLMTIRDADGVSHVFTSVSRNELRTGNLFQNHEETTEYFVNTYFELEQRNHQTKAIEPCVTMAYFITDKHAFGYQVREYFQKIENMIQDPSFFNEAQYDIEKDYKRVSIEFEVRLYLRAIDGILAASENDAWKALAQAYGISPRDWGTDEARQAWVPWYYYLLSFRVREYAERIQLYEDAKSMVNYFVKIKKETNRKRRAELLAEFHHSVGFDHHLVTMMLLLADPENIYYRLQVRGSKVPEVTRTWGKEIVFERPDTHENEEKEMDGDPLMIKPHVSNMKLAFDPTERRFKIVFDSTVDPNNIEGFYLNISLISGWWIRNKKLYLTTDAAQLYKEFSFNGQTVTLYLDKLSDVFLFDSGNRYELSFAFKEKNKKIFSTEPKVVFKYVEAPEIKPQWINIDGKSTIMGY